MGTQNVLFGVETLTEQETPLINGRYRLLEKLGEGGMAVVWKAQDTALGRVVALKVLRPQYASDPDFVARFRREAQAAANLAHPNIVNVYDIGEADGQPFIVMEYVDGRNLKEIIREEGALPVVRALDLAIQTAVAVAHAHRAGIVHRDLKPQNILVTREDQVKVTDFGIARALGTASATQTGVVLGTAHYLAPEQALGEPATPASDVYALGVVLYEMLAGQPPFEAENSMGVVMKHIREEPIPVQQRNPHVPDSVAAIIAHAMAKDPTERYADAGALAVALREVREWGEQVTGVQEPVAAPLETGFDFVGMLLGLVALAAVLGLIPLWRAVYREYVGTAAPAVVPLPRQTAPVVRLSTVPDVVGLFQAEAEDRLREAGFRVRILGSRQDETVPVSHVLQTDPPAGTQAPLGSVVGLIVSSGPPAAEVPRVVGLPAEEAERLLREAGFKVVRTEGWGGDVLPGRVVAQEPPAGASISRGSPITIVISTGPVIKIEANLGDQVELVEAELTRDTFRPGEMLQITLRWRARRPIDQDYVVFVHVTPPSGIPIAQQDSRPVGGGFPTPAWTPGQLVNDVYRVTLPANATPGRYQIRVGMYPKGQPQIHRRLPVVDPGRAEAALNSIIVKEIEIVP